MTQDQLASEIGVSRQAISKWEQGDGLPDLHNVQALANVLDISVDTLLNHQSTSSLPSSGNSFSTHSTNNMSGNF